ncbi:MAG: hypothetical protein AAF967_07820 [Pseudomonadota bacterium]
MLQPIPTPLESHSAASSLREQYLEYGFLAGVCRVMWRRGELMDVLRSHTDQSGYDLLLEARGIQRHVQLKSSFLGAKTSRQKINTRLAARPSGCIVWIRFDPTTLAEESFLWFGGVPGAPLPDLGARVAKHTKGNAEGIKTERADIRVVNKGTFETVNGFEALAVRLFGGDPPENPPSS